MEMRLHLVVVLSMQWVCVGEDVKMGQNADSVGSKVPRQGSNELEHG
jgi:hypothetical protein